MFEVQVLLVLAMVATAAAIDWRTGEIPNWLTLPPLAAAPVIYACLWGTPGLVASLVGLLACGLVPFILFRKDAIGGGDVKLLAAIGAVGGLYLGIEAQLFAFLVAAGFAIAALTWQGSLRATVTTSFRLLVNPLLPRARRRPIDRRGLTSIRLGPAILVGTLIAAWGAPA
jgi:prepilin peptidase CpaA